MYCVFINDLLQQLRQCQFGITIGEINVTSPAHADDIALLALYKVCLNGLLKICHEYSKKNGDSGLTSWKPNSWCGDLTTIQRLRCFLETKYSINQRPVNIWGWHSALIRDSKGRSVAKKLELVRPRWVRLEDLVAIMFLLLHASFQNYTGQCLFPKWRMGTRWHLWAIQIWMNWKTLTDRMQRSFRDCHLIFQSLPL